MIKIEGLNMVIGACAAVLLALFIGLVSGYKIGHALGENKGYQQGWSDAGCGIGRACEAGQE